MKAEERRKLIRQTLTSQQPTSATTLAEMCSVSRQVIVGDIALLRAAGLEIVATPRGYKLGEHSGLLRTVVECLAWLVAMVLAAMISQVVSGVIYNADTLKEAGVNPEDIRTLEDFEATCEKIKALGKTPIHIGGKDSGNAAGFLGSIAPAMLTDEGCIYPNGDELKNGTFDWEQYGTPVMQKIADYVNNGYINVDFTTADTKTMQTALGAGDCGFVFRNTPNIVNARNYVEGCNVGIIPIPSSTEEGKSSFRIGEGTCLGIWKDTENYDAAAAFLEYLARPEVAKAICLINGSVPALVDVNVDDDYAVTAFHTAQQQFDGDLYYDNIFDREYFPSGMWGVMADSVTEVVMDPTEAGVASSVKILEENYLEKYAEAKAQ